MTAIAGEFVLGDYVARRNSAIYSEVRDLGLLSPIQHRLDNVGRQQGQAKDAADVGPIGLLDGGDFRVG